MPAGTTSADRSQELRATITLSCCGKHWTKIAMAAVAMAEALSLRNGRPYPTQLEFEDGGVTTNRENA